MQYLLDCCIFVIVNVKFDNVIALLLSSVQKHVCCWCEFVGQCQESKSNFFIFRATYLVLGSPGYVKSTRDYSSLQPFSENDI